MRIRAGKVLGSTLDPRTPAYDIQQACGTGLQAVIAAANQIALGAVDSAIAGGSDTTSSARSASTTTCAASCSPPAARGRQGARLAALAAVRPRHLVPDIPRNAEPRTGLSMGDHAAVTARRWAVAREDQDHLAATSHQRLAAAYERGFLDDLVVPYRGLDRDQNLRPDSTPEKLARLKPVFGTDGPNPTMTAGNSTPLTDGAATVLLASESGRGRGLEPLAYLSLRAGAVDYVDGDDGLLMAPAYAVPRLLERAGLGIEDFDLYEIHEAFASRCWPPSPPGRSRAWPRWTAPA
ncbi:acetyl-CoA acetyltransferase [Streptomyces badius]